MSKLGFLPIKWVGFIDYRVLRFVTYIIAYGLGVKVIFSPFSGFRVRLEDFLIPIMAYGLRI